MFKRKKRAGSLMDLLTASMANGEPGPAIRVPEGNKPRPMPANTGVFHPPFQSAN